MRKTKIYSELRKFKVSLDSKDEDKEIYDLGTEQRVILHDLGFINICDPGIRNIILPKGRAFIKKYEGRFGRIELLAETYPFISALSIGFAGGLGATTLNIFFK